MLAPALLLFQDIFLEVRYFVITVFLVHIKDLCWDFVSRLILKPPAILILRLFVIVLLVSHALIFSVGIRHRYVLLLIFTVILVIIVLAPLLYWVVIWILIAQIPANVAASRLTLSLRLILHSNVCVLQFFAIFFLILAFFEQLRDFRYRLVE